MNQIQTENSFYTTPSIAHSPSDTDIPVEEWLSTSLDLMLRFTKEFNADYKEVEEYLKENANFDIEKDIVFIDEYPLSIDYIEPDVNDTPPHWQYLILYGGPTSEIRFFVNNKSSTEPYKVEFWYSDWFNTVGQDVTGEAIIEQLWEQSLLPLTEQMETQNEELSPETQETDPLLALAGTLEHDVTEIKKQFKDSVRPKVRVVKGAYEDHPDPLIALLGTLECDVTDIGERHDDYIGDALLAELWGEKDELGFL